MTVQPGRRLAKIRVVSVSEEPNVKTCCDGAYPSHALYCSQCGEALEETHYRLWIVLTLLAAVAVEWWLAATGVLVRFRWPEVLMLEVLLLQFAYPLAKLAQKARNRERPVLREMATVFADRWSRILLIAAWVFIGLLWARVLPRSTALGKNLIDPSDAALRQLLVRIDLAGFAVASALILASQGIRFFDLRVPNTLSPRHR